MALVCTLRAKIHPIECDLWFWGWSSQPLCHHHHHHHQHHHHHHTRHLGFKHVKTVPSSYLIHQTKGENYLKATSWDLYTLWMPNMLKHISTLSLLLIILLQQHMRTQNAVTLSCQYKEKQINNTEDQYWFSVGCNIYQTINHSVWVSRHQLETYSMLWSDRPD